MIEFHILMTLQRHNFIELETKRKFKMDQNLKHLYAKNFQGNL